MDGLEAIEAMHGGKAQLGSINSAGKLVVLVSSCYFKSLSTAKWACIVPSLVPFVLYFSLSSLSPHKNTRS
jgi:hypothetical protein